MKPISLFPRDKRSNSNQISNFKIKFNRLKVYDVLGNEIITLVKEEMPVVATKLNLKRSIFRVEYISIS